MSADILYQMSKYRLIAINYQKVCIPSYGFGYLKVINEFGINGCSDILPFTDHLILIS